PEWYRDPVQARFSMPVEEWEKQNNTTLEEGLYKGTLRKGEHHAGCGCALVNGGEAKLLQLA
ncbi:MAG: hypothetical protein ACE5PO_07420, partial [Candidatus Bathyarchaeia archaeon]